MVRRSVRLAQCSLIVVLALGGCGNSPKETRQLGVITAEPPCNTAVRLVPPHIMAKTRAEQATHEAHCPMRVSGTTVTSSDVEEGVALYFTTSGDVNELRQRVRELATTHAHDGASPSDACGCPLLGDRGVPLMAEASTSAEPTPGGARLLLVPNERNEVVRLRARVAESLTRFAASHCAGRL